MRSIRPWLSRLLVLGIGMGAFGAPSAQSGQIRHVIHISVDGLRGDLLKDLLDTQPFGFPGFARLRAEGACTFNARCDFGASTTVPNHTSMLTGLPLVAPASAPEWQQHGYVINYDVPGDTLHINGLPARYKPSVFDRVHDRGLGTMLLASKSKFGLFDTSYNAVNGAPDLEGEDQGRDKIDFALIRNGDSSILAAVLISRLGEGFPAYTFLHIFDPDFAGHLYGWGSLNWQLAVKHADSVIGLILSALDLRPELKESTAVVLTADHGGGVPSWSHIDPVPRENYTIPVMIWGPGVPPGVDAYSLFANRRDPGPDRPENDAALAPLRNGDTGNIALALLGLPPITDSFYRPEWSGGLEVIVWPDGSVHCAWPLLWAGWTLESSASLEEGLWELATRPPLPLGLRWHHQESPALTPHRFFRLRAPE